MKKVKKKILVTGCCGFIGFNLCNKLSDNFSIFGIDNLNNYYDKKLKLARLKIIEKKIKFKKLDIRNYNDLNNFVNNNNFDVVVHLAAQAGVRYSFENPKSYIDNNISATFNLLDILKNEFKGHFLFSSTSSVYGFNNTKKPVNEFTNTNNPISMYSATKKSCEELIHNFSFSYQVPCTTMRFFTVYGPWGRPDMALFKFIDQILKGKTINVYNHGELWRDFTFIDDLIKSIIGLLNMPPKKNDKFKYDNISDAAPYRIVNIGNQKPIKLSNFIEIIEDILSIKASKKYLPMQMGEVPFTFSDSKLLKELTRFSPNTDIRYGVEAFIQWYKSYYNVF